ncbi:MAG: penicillin-insensitive murein endopeptidase, partial [Methylomonas sp.]
WFLLSEQADRHILTDYERETWNATPVVDMQAYAVDYRQWSPAHAKILETAARQPEVDRIFVHPGIKLALCERKSPESAVWLRKIRPWWKHDDHFHVRLQCPPNNPRCESQEHIPAGDGCDASLNWWFSAEARQPAKSKPEPPPPLPAECEMILREK